MDSELYTPGQSENSVSFMAQRTLESHGAFVLPSLNDGMEFLDCGCGPGTITCDIAALLPNSTVVGVDASEESIHAAEAQAAARGLSNVTFHRASVYDLPFDDRRFDMSWHTLFWSISANRAQ